MFSYYNLVLHVYVLTMLTSMNWVRRSSIPLMKIGIASVLISIPVVQFSIPSMKISIQGILAIGGLAEEAM